MLESVAAAAVAAAAEVARRSPAGSGGSHACMPLLAPMNKSFQVKEWTTMANNRVIVSLVFATGATDVEKGEIMMRESQCSMDGTASTMWEAYRGQGLDPVPHSWRDVEFHLRCFGGTDAQRARCVQPAPL